MTTSLSLLFVAFAITSAQRRNNNGGLRKTVIKSARCEDVEKIEAGDTVSVFYTGKLLADGTVFDSNEGKSPLEFEVGVGKVIPGWDQGLLGSCPGETFRLVIPSDLAYGEQGAGGGVIPPNAELDFTVTVEGLKKELKIEVLKKVDCDSEKRTREKDKISVHYNATLANGQKAFSSYDSNTPLEMTIGKAGIKGWDEGTKGACVGEVRRVVVPPSLAYGEKGIEGVIPPNATLILEMEFLKIEDRVLSFLDRISSGNFGRGK
eukprot:TCALIF_02785-PA protein Name:"Similar to Fkbp10 Peptidyl-prolyl cis-trans isomerase FKBP10 (Mus musculus)" AED:0.13 eAED:0.13 QI:0/0.75/0.6/0.8/1/1/5/215/262